MTRTTAFRSLSPQAARFRHLVRMPAFRAIPPLALRTRARVLTQRQRSAFLASLGSAAGFEAACAEAGIPPGAAVAERVRNPRFAREWDQHLDACITQLETLLVEKAMTTLARGFPGTDARDKWLVALVQWLLESRRTQAQRGRTAGVREAPDVRDVAPAPDPARDERDDARKIDALIEAARARLVAAEAQMAKDGFAVEVAWTAG